MAEEPIQNYANHVRHDRMIYATAVVYLVALVLGIAGLYFDSARVVGAGLLVAIVGGVMAASMTRGYAVKLQDRIVRLEMRLRLERVLPEDLRGRIAEFSLRQLIALRFASDEELPDLARKVLDDKIESGDEIKKQVKNWQADWHRV